MSWSTITQEVTIVGSSLAVWEEHAQVGLLPEPGGSPLERARAEVDDWHAAGLRFVTVINGDYPRRLLEIHETPSFLFVEGDLRRSGNLGRRITKGIAEGP